MHSPVRCLCPRALKVFAVLLLVLGAVASARALDASAMQAMIMVEGDEGLGSGFIVKMGGQTFLVTNSHVIRGNRNVKFKDLRNTALVTGPLEIADEVDAVRATVAGASNALELETHIDNLRIGDDVIVAGNSEGAGVVREIPGKIVGIGPDRLEVDAPFVPGNSGSPILLKSTGKVIGIATYMRLPRSSDGQNSPFSLNEVRRFGYRLDTVGKWIKPQSKDRLFIEGMKLSEMEKLIEAVTSILDSNASAVSKWGGSNFASRDQIRQFAAFASLSMAVDNFGRQYAMATNSEARTRSASDFFARLRGIFTEDVRGLSETEFTGYYSLKLKTSLDEVKQFNDWYESTAMPVYRETWMGSPVADQKPQASSNPQPARKEKPAAATSGNVVTADSRDFSISGNGFAIATLQDGAKAFSNRGYVWQQVPQSMNGHRYTQVGGGEPVQLTIRAKRDFELEVITAADQPGSSLPGWQRTATGFTYSDGKGRNSKGSRVGLFRKSLTSGQEIQISQANWTGVLVVFPD